MSATEIERHTGGTLELRAGQDEWTARQRAALAQLGLAQASNADLAVFLHQAQRTGLDPFSRQIYMIARWDNQSRSEKFTIQTGIDGFRVIADRHPQYGGQVGPEWCGKDGVWRDVWVSDEAPAAARVGVIRKDWAQPIYATALFREYAGTTKDKQTQRMVLTRMWREKGALMIAKCAEALALRKAFPHDLSGIYTAEEMTQADQAPREHRQVQDRLADPAWAAKTATTYEREHGVPEPAGRPADESSPVAVDEPDWDALVAEVAKTGVVTTAWRLAREHRPGDLALRERIQTAARERRDPAHPAPADDVVDAEVVDEPQPVTQAQHKHMHALWNTGGISDREERLAITSVLVGRAVGSSSELTAAEADVVISRLREHDKGTGVLYKACSGWLDEAAAASEAAQSSSGEDQP